jgi:Icc-related predicted phosphoesterase
MLLQAIDGQEDSIGGGRMNLLLFSDLHSDRRCASDLVAMSQTADVVVGAGDYCIMRRGLEEAIRMLSGIDRPTVLVPGNSESHGELRRACRDWKQASVLHGEAVEIDGVPFFGLGGGVPVTPFGSWSYDFTESQAAALLVDCPEGGVLISHSPPKGVLDHASDGKSLGSESVRAVVESRRPRLVVCGHIHGSSGRSHRLNGTDVVNAGPAGILWHL